MARKQKTSDDDNVISMSAATARLEQPPAVGTPFDEAGSDIAELLREIRAAKDEGSDLDAIDLAELDGLDLLQLDDVGDDGVAPTTPEDDPPAAA